MNGLIMLRNKIKRLFAAADIIIMPVLKFVLALIVLTIINKKLGYLEILSEIFVVLIISVLCALMPFAGTAVVGVVFIVLHCFGLSMMTGVISLLLYICLLILVFRFVPKDSPVLFLGPIADMLGISCSIPLGLGLAGNAGSAFSAAGSVLSVSFLRTLPSAAEMLKGGEASAMEMINGILDGFLLNEETIIMMICAAAAVLIVHFLKGVLEHYTWAVSVIAGAAGYAVIYAIGSAVLTGKKPDAKALLLNIVISLVIALVMAFFLHSLDYSRAKKLRFEDDEFYYYVKAVPKNIMSDSFGDEENLTEPEDDEDAPYRKKLEDTLQDL